MTEASTIRLDIAKQVFQGHRQVSSLPGELGRIHPDDNTDLSQLRLKLPRFRGVFDGFVDYGSMVTTSIASYAIGER